MNASEIDAAVLNVVQPSWRKVAMIIVKAAEKLGTGLPDGEDGYNLIAARIEALVTDGRLEAQGDVTRWRHSEVRQPQNPELTRGWRQ